MAHRLLVSATLWAALGCGGDTYCQSGSKYGTQCTTLNDVRNPPGAPMYRNEHAWWNQPAPPGTFGSSGSTAGTGTSAPMSSPAWKPAAAASSSSSATPVSP